VDEYIGIFKDLKLKGDRLLFIIKVAYPLLIFVESLDYNYRMDELNAVLGCSQVERIEEILDKPFPP